ncbi:YciI family protein [Tessaracoccus lapidicaptus]|uniref:YciI family protein n=1 Tax=Tessaracoccus lapidicaptus TaxID=1427523 RepID=UPI00333F3BF3
MSYFAVQYTYIDDARALDAERPHHRAYLSTLLGGSLVVSGPYVDSELPGALLIMRAGSADELEQLLDLDPFWTANLIAERSVEEWNPVLGSLSAD